jgi:NAD+ synthase
MNTQKVIEHITGWLKTYSENSRTNGFVIGVSGGIDSAVTSTLCAMTGKDVLCLELPIYQAQAQVTRAQEHIAWLSANYPNIKDIRVELTPTFDAFKAAVHSHVAGPNLDLSLANTRARLRMTTLYYYAGLHGMLVAGTGNKVEDFGIGFYTKYGDGGVDLSPIADLNKTQVYALAKHLGIIDSIQKAAPTDGLFGDSRTDEDQIGASYPELEWAMAYIENHNRSVGKWTADEIEKLNFTERQKHVMKIYMQRNKANRHKMDPIPVCNIPAEWLN